MERAATKIQASWKGHAVRRELVHHVRRDFEETVRRVEGGLSVRETNLQIVANAQIANSPTSSSVEWKTTRAVSRPILSSPPGGVENRAYVSGVGNAGALGATRVVTQNERTSDTATWTNEKEKDTTSRRLDVLRKELHWAQTALDDRRQHLRRLRMESSETTDEHVS